MSALFQLWQTRRTRDAKRVASPAYSIYALQTGADTWLGADPCGPATARPLKLQNGKTDIPVLLIVVSADRGFGYLVAHDGEPIEIPGLDVTGTCLPVKIDRDHPKGRLRLFHPLAKGRRFGQDDGRLTLDLRPPDAALAFSCEAFDGDQLAPVIVTLATRIANSVQLPARWQPILEDLHTGKLSPRLAEVLLYRLPTDELQDLSLEILRSARSRQLVATCLPSDPWIARRIDRMLAWRADRDAARLPKLVMSDQHFPDVPGQKGNLSYQPRLGLFLNTLMRRHTQPRRMACVVGSARNEGPYLLEWIAYHRAIGFDHVFIYTNDNSDGSDQLLDVLARNGIVTWVRSELGPNTLPQFKAYAHALSVLPETLDYRWTLVSDLDEFLAYDTARFASLRDYLAWQETGQADAIALPWLIYLAGRDDTWRDAPCTERFTMRQSHVNHHVKTIFRTNLFWSSTAHNPYASLGLPISYKADNGMPHIAKAPENNLALAHNPQATHAWIAHYIFKSASDAVMKATRGKGDRIESERHAGIESMMKHFVSLTKNTSLVVDERTATCGLSLSNELSALRAIRGVASCEADIRETYQRQMRKLCARIIREGRKQDEPEECAVFRSILLKQYQNELFSVA
jgi:hypothetical protein